MLVFKSENDSEEPKDTVTLILDGSGWYCEQGTPNQQEWLCSVLVAPFLPDARKYAKEKGFNPPKLLEYHDRNTRSRPGLIVKKKNTKRKK